jgi:AraC family transcriptional regulator, alkane utilization regulator
MTATPSSVARTTARVPPPAGSDVLSELLGAVRLSGAVFLSARFTAPFGIVSPKRYDSSMPMAHLRHLTVLHLIAAGSCIVETANGLQREVGPGDVILLPFTDQHTFRNGEAVDLAFAPDMIGQSPIAGVWNVSHGGGGNETHMVCGFVESSELLFAPLFRTLPELLIERTGDDKVGTLIASTVREIVAAVDAATPGTHMMLGRMMELLFIEVLRRHASRLPAGNKGWFAALNDPILGRALQLVHADPARRWTVDLLAGETGSSRTVLTERFNTLLGRPPIDYVTSWRIQLAADRLSSSAASVSRIAADIGYESEAAFNRAFKRATGTTPGRWRDGARDFASLTTTQFAD